MKRYRNRNIGGIVEYTSNSEYGIPVANMDEVAKNSGFTHKSMNDLINNHKKSLKSLDKSKSLRFETEVTSRHLKTYLLTSPQFTFIVTRMNNHKSEKLQIAVSKQFNFYINTQLERQAVHQLSKGAVKSFSNAIKINLNDPAGYMYGHLTNLAYKYALGVGVKKIQTLRGAKGTSNKKDYLSSHEIELLSKAMNKIEAFLEVGMTYDDIKHFVSNHCLNKAKITVKLGGIVNE